ncbi:MAG: hypothetical protein LBQ10_06175 [Desulfovibrio sp.]|jgi:hypothetical protein|nr:hypothetical protein [Desulfovibrio sp.]
MKKPIESRIEALRGKIVKARRQSRTRQLLTYGMLLQKEFRHAHATDRQCLFDAAQRHLTGWYLSYALAFFLDIDDSCEKNSTVENAKMQKERRENRMIAAKINHLINNGFVNKDSGNNTREENKKIDALDKTFNELRKKERRLRLLACGMLLRKLFKESDAPARQYRRELAEKYLRGDELEFVLSGFSEIDVKFPPAPPNADAEADETENHSVTTTDNPPLELHPVKHECPTLTLGDSVSRFFFGVERSLVVVVFVVVLIGVVHLISMLLGILD